MMVTKTKIFPLTSELSYALLTFTAVPPEVLAFTWEVRRLSECSSRYDSEFSHQARPLAVTHVTFPFFFAPCGLGSTP